MLRATNEGTAIQSDQFYIPGHSNLPRTAQDSPKIRQFDTGATRDVDADKYDFEGFLCPLVIESFGKYMHKHRFQPNGELRSSDNWQKGIPLSAYMKSGWRHFRQWWRLHRGIRTFDEKGVEITMEDAINGILFNAMGYLHETLKTPISSIRIKPGSIVDVDNIQTQKASR